MTLTKNHEIITYQEIQLGKTRVRKNAGQACAIAFRVFARRESNNATTQACPRSPSPRKISAVGDHQPTLRMLKVGDPCIQSWVESGQAGYYHFYEINGARQSYPCRTAIHSTGFLRGCHNTSGAFTHLFKYRAETNNRSDSRFK